MVTIIIVKVGIINIYEMLKKLVLVTVMILLRVYIYRVKYIK